MTRRSWTAGFLLLGILAAGGAVNRAAVRATFAMDDFAQRAMIEGKLTPRRGPFNLYDLVADDNRAALLDRGVIPWWSDPHLTVRFLRPLPSLCVWLDHRLFGNESFGPHVLSFLWWAAAVLAAHVLYRTDRRKAGCVDRDVAVRSFADSGHSARVAGEPQRFPDRDLRRTGTRCVCAVAGRQTARPRTRDLRCVRRSCSYWRIRAVPRWIPDRLRALPSWGGNSSPCGRGVAGRRAAPPLYGRARAPRIRYSGHGLLSRSDH